MFSQTHSRISHHHAWLVAIAMLASVMLSGCQSVAPHASSNQMQLYQSAAASTERTDADRESDGHRKPVAFLDFAQVQPGMRCLDVFAGAGYTSELLALVVGDTGHVWAQNDRERDSLTKRLVQHPRANLEPLVRPFDDPVAQGVAGLDIVTIIMSYHDIANTTTDRSKMDRLLFAALKPGGHLILIDHSARAGSGTEDSNTLHRIDEQLVKNEFTAAGFKLEYESDFLRNPADPRTQAFFKMSDPSDKFALRFVKPQ
jgi:predicted methyltransferase